MSKFDDFLSEIRDGAKQLAKDLFKDAGKEAADDTREFLNKSKDKLKKWTKELQDRELNKDEFKDLVEGQRALAKLYSLTQAGVAATKLERFRSGLINLVIDKAFDVLL
jgi:hypothetical protein